MPSLSHIGPERPRLCRPSLKRDFLHQNRDHPAVSFIFSHAATLDIDTRGYSLWGSSAGARIAARIGSHGLQRFGGENHPKPSTVVMAYTGHSDHTSTEPATFVVVGEDDGIAPPATMERRVAALRSIGTHVEYRKFPGLTHGFGAGTGTHAAGWIAEATSFWGKNIPYSGSKVGWLLASDSA
ncbi:prolyl oligopeptidase family serine peptidase [Hydrogenophaga taeniospiralis]|uniref:alpha/beta hydrolase n=1 Tax=Hydrogenophaga taeniospiralis TaxID=65656 RepID=UPI00299F25F0|nr:prolyl oligopeptidase family serine peptidase [Hydrogenophaga taeniospiralis]MCB4365496.1 prolyl oligopeptidase family serine peptidase [Hydrogenophaga taeniospiralis]